MRRSLPLFLKAFQERSNERGKTHSECGWPHPARLGPRENPRGKGQY